MSPRGGVSQERYISLDWRFGLEEIDVDIFIIMGCLLGMELSSVSGLSLQLVTFNYSAHLGLLGMIDFRRVLEWVTRELILLKGEMIGWNALPDNLKQQ